MLNLAGPETWARTNGVFDAWMKGRDSPADWSWKRTVDLGDGKRTVVTYGFTHQGNGTIELKNLVLRIWREHKGEGFTYDPAAFRADLAPNTGSRSCDLVVSGWVTTFAENDSVTGHGPARLVYRYEAATQNFRRVFGKAPIPLSDIDLSR